MDVVKGIGILLVIWAHLQGWLSKEIYIFHMPLFFFSSGMCFKDKKDFIRTRFKSLIIPFILFNLAFGIIYYFEGGKHLKMLHLFSWKITSAIDGPTWFLLALFHSSVAYWTLNRCCKNSAIKIAISFAIALPFYYCKSILPLDFRQGMTALPFFALGHWFSVNKHNICNRWWKYATMIAVFSGTIIYCRLKPIQFDLHSGSLPGFFPIYYLGALSASILLLQIPWFSKPNFINKSLALFGRKSLYIMALHMPYMWTIFNKIHNLKVFTDKDINDAFTIISTFLIISAASLLLSVIISWCVNKLKRKRAKEL